MMSVTRVNPLQTAIALGSGLEDSPCLPISRRVTLASDLGCSIGDRVTQLTRVAQSTSTIDTRGYTSVLAAWYKIYVNSSLCPNDYNLATRLC